MNNHNIINMPRGSVKCDFCEKMIKPERRRQNIDGRTQCMSCYAKKRRSEADDDANYNNINEEQSKTKKIRLSYRRYPFSKSRYAFSISSIFEGLYNIIMTYSIIIIIHTHLMNFILMS